MGWNTRIVFVNLLVLLCVLEIVYTCNIRELNNVIEEHFKKELQLKKCAKVGQSCQLDKDCCKHLECKMGVSDDGIVNVCKPKEIVEEDTSNSGMNVEDYQEKTGDQDGNMDWMNNDEPRDNTAEKKDARNNSESDYSDESETILKQDQEGNQDKNEERRQKLLKENEELEKLFTEKEEREIEQLKALKEDEEVDELRKLRELKIKRKLQLLKELQELRSLKANDDFQNILEYKERKRLGVNETTAGQYNGTVKENQTGNKSEHDKKDSTETEQKADNITETIEKEVGNKSEINIENVSRQERVKDENDDVEDQTKENADNVDLNNEASGSGENVEGNEDASGNGEKEIIKEGSGNREEGSGNDEEGSGHDEERSGDGEANEDIEASGNGEEHETPQEGSGNGDQQQGSGDGTKNEEENAEATSGDGEAQTVGETKNEVEEETIPANETIIRPTNEEVTNSTVGL